MTRRLQLSLSLALPMALLAAVSVLGVQAVGAKAPPLTHKTSYVRFYSGHVPTTAATSPCASKGCANGIEFYWPAATCYHTDRYPPIALLFTNNGVVSKTSWPLYSPCSTGVTFSWDTNNHLNSGIWQNAPSGSAKAGLSVCFQKKHECSAARCVTSGCIPKSTNGIDMFFTMASDAPTSAEWLLNGKPDGPISVAGSPDSLFVYGVSPPTTPYATPTSGSNATPNVAITGRGGNNKPQTTKHTAPSNANGVAMSWFLPGYESGPSRGCHEINGQWVPSFPLVYAYTTNGRLSGPITSAHCAVDSYNSPIPFSHLDFSWTHGATGYTLTGADSVNHGSGSIVHNNCTGTYEATTSYSSSNLPQPPMGANGVVVTYAHDDADATCWLTNGKFFSSKMSRPAHSRLEILQP